jgi:hypothetical protein
MNRSLSKRVVLSGLLGTAILASIAFMGASSVQAQLPSLPSLPGGLKMPSVPSGMSGFAGLDALNTAKDLYPKDKAGFPTPNIAVSGSNVVIAWPTGVVTIETIANDGTIHRTILGPPSDKNTR